MDDSISEPLQLLADRSIRGYVRRLVGFSDRADDVLQTVAEKLLTRRGQIRDPHHFLIQAARNTVIDEFRARERRDSREQSYADATAAANSEEPEAACELEQFLDSLGVALGELPLLSQSLFWEHYVQGHTQSDLAKLHCLHISTVEKHLRRARRHCFQRLSAQRS
ncbi:MAG: RNA polymerase sigma factor [Pseudomonadota bacterium]